LGFEDECKLMWILETPFQKKKLSKKPHLKAEETSDKLLFEIGPRFAYT
jgi:hypothetical protein